MYDVKVVHNKKSIPIFGMLLVGAESLFRFFIGRFEPPTLPMKNRDALNQLS